MKEQVLLPGVSRDVARRPTPQYDRATVNRTQQREDFRDLADLLLLAGVDVLALTWDAAHVPLLSRESTLELLLAANAVLGAFIIGRRLWPVLRARRIASTWSEQERGTAENNKSAGV